MSHKKYLGITIGPILSTLSLTSTPAGLWGASYLFSFFTKTLVECLKEDMKLEDEAFISPVWEEETKDIVENCKWAGLFHDRIIIDMGKKLETSQKVDRQNIEEVSEKDIKEVIKDAIKRAKGKVAEVIFKALEREGAEKKAVQDYINKYIQVQTVIRELKQEENPILVLGKFLDGLELGGQFIEKENVNYILWFLENRENLKQKKGEERNRIIKQSSLVMAENDEKWHFLGNGDKILSIDDIAGASERGNVDTQGNNYYAIVNADGDNLTKVLKAMKNQDLSKKIRCFSIACFKYASKAFETVERYGGKVIYAGGDDLLFLAPVMQSTGNQSSGQPITLFHLVNQLKEDFDEAFKKFSFDTDKKMRLSIGAVICYYKFPLYEALNLAFEQLKKSKKIKGKNSLSVHFEKHSGKQRILQFKNFSSGVGKKYYDEFLGLLEVHAFSERDFLRSVSRKLSVYQKLIMQALKREKNVLDEDGTKFLNNVIKNLFEDYPVTFSQKRDKMKEGFEEANYIEEITKLLRIGYYLDKGEEALDELIGIIGLLAFYRKEEKR